MSCKLLSTNILNDICTEDFKGGFESVAYIFNRSQIDFGTSTESGVKITNIAMTSNNKGVKISSPMKNPYTGTVSEGSSTDLAPTLVKTTILNLMANTQANAIAEKALMNGEFVIILEQKAKGDTSSITATDAFIVYGWEQGLKFSSSTKDYNADATAGAVVTMNEEKCYEPQLFFDKGGYSATKTALESLVTA